ncbi:MAG: nucleotide synthetase [Rhizomicrobium sp.]
MTTFKALKSPGESHPLPTWNGDPAPFPDTRTYTLSLRIGSDGYLEPNVVSGTDYDPAEDGPLELRVQKKDCMVTIELDKAIDWEFRRELPMSLGVAPDGQDRYFDVQGLPVDAASRCMSISFRALLLKQGTPKVNKDPYNLHFRVYLRRMDGTRINTPLSLTIDPDIKNPGDVVGHGILSAARGDAGPATR